jgi:hypothetical protein
MVKHVSAETWDRAGLDGGATADEIQKVGQPLLQCSSARRCNMFHAMLAGARSSRTRPQVRNGEACALAVRPSVAGVALKAGQVEDERAASRAAPRVGGLAKKKQAGARAKGVKFAAPTREEVPLPP